MQFILIKKKNANFVNLALLSKGMNWMRPIALKHFSAQLHKEEINFYFICKSQIREIIF